MKSKKCITIPEDLFQMLCDHFRVGITYDLDIDTEEKNSDYYQRIDQIKKMLEEKQNKILIRNAYTKNIKAETPEEKKKTYELYKMMKSTFADENTTAP